MVLWPCFSPPCDAWHSTHFVEHSVVSYWFLVIFLSRSFALRNGRSHCVHGISRFFHGGYGFLVIQKMRGPWRSSFRCPTSRAWKPDPLCIISQKLASISKVNVAELFFEIVNCSCLKPPVTDSLLRSGSWEENMLAAPFKSCWRPCRSSFQCPTSGPDLLPECQTCQQPLH